MSSTYFVLHEGHPLSAHAQFSEKTNISNLAFHVRVRIRGLKMLAFRKILRTYLMDGPILTQAH